MEKNCKKVKRACSLNRYARVSIAPDQLIVYVAHFSEKEGKFTMRKQS